MTVVQQAFLLGSWLGGALCYSLVLAAGDRRLPMVQVICCSLIWPLSLAFVLLTPGERR